MDKQAAAERSCSEQNYNLAVHQGPSIVLLPTAILAMAWTSLVHLSQAKKRFFKIVESRASR
jgi:hypothetical protein